MTPNPSYLDSSVKIGEGRVGDIGRTGSHEGRRWNELPEAEMTFQDAVWPRLEVTDLEAGLGQHQAQPIRQLAGGALEQKPGLRDHGAGTGGNRMPQLAQDTADEVNARRTVSDPGRAQAMQRSEGLLGYGLDGDRVDLYVAVRLEESLGIASGAT